LSSLCHRVGHGGGGKCWTFHDIIVLQRIDGQALRMIWPIDTRLCQSVIYWGSVTHMNKQSRTLYLGLFKIILSFIHVSVNWDENRYAL
jgi:hypothetical protein